MAFFNSYVSIPEGRGEAPILANFGCPESSVSGSGFDFGSQGGPLGANERGKQSQN